MNKLTNMIQHIFAVLVIAGTPLLLNAQAPANDIESLVRFLANIFQRWLIPMFVTLAMIYVIVAAIQYIMANEDSQRKNEKRQQMFWGIVGLFVIISIWSLVAIVQNTFNIFGGFTLQPGN